jgi:hypothetical protein
LLICGFACLNIGDPAIVNPTGPLTENADQGHEKMPRDRSIAISIGPPQRSDLEGGFNQ